MRSRARSTAAQVGVRLHMGDEQEIDVGCPEMHRDERIISGEDIWHQTAKDDQEDVLVTELVDEPQQRKLGPCSRIP